MAKAQKLAQLQQALQQLAAAEAVVTGGMAAVKVTKDGRRLGNQLLQLHQTINVVKARKQAADQHIYTYQNEGRWKKLKNKAIPGLTAARNSFKAEVAKTDDAVEKAEALYKKAYMVAQTAHWL